MITETRLQETLGEKPILEDAGRDGSATDLMVRFHKQHAQIFLGLAATASHRGVNSTYGFRSGSEFLIYVFSVRFLSITVKFGKGVP